MSFPKHDGCRNELQTVPPDVAVPGEQLHLRRPTSFREVAQRLFGTATNLLVTGLILMVAIVLGRHMLLAWNAESPVPLAIGTTGQRMVDGPTWRSAQSGWLEFGDRSAALLRSEVRGDTAAAMSVLRRDCRAAADVGSPDSVQQSPALRDWLSRLDQQAPIERVSGKWSLYELRQPLPMAVMVRDPPPSSHGTSPSVSAADRGVISWGLAFPAEPESAAESTVWTSFVFTPSSLAPASRAESGMVLPTGCRRLIAIHSTDSSLIGFASNEEPAQLMADWDRTQAAGGWRIVGEGRVIPPAWHRRFERHVGEIMDVQFAQESSGAILGFCLVKKD